MGRQLNAVRADELLHPFQVVPQLVFIEHSARQAQIFVEQIPAERGNLFGFERSIQQAQALVQGRDGGSRGCVRGTWLAHRMNLREASK